LKNVIRRTAKCSYYGACDRKTCDRKMDTISPSLQTLMTAALTLTLAWYIAYWYVNKRGVMVGAGAAVAKADKDDKDEAIRDEFEEAAATPVGLAGTISEQRIDPNTRAALLPDAKRAAPGAPVPMLPRRAATTTVPAPCEATIRSPQVLAPRRTRSDGASILAYVPRVERGSSRLNRLRASPVASC
jgi:hypothetical protein